MSARELIEWIAYWTIEPPLAERIEVAIAILSSLTANIHRDSKTRPEPFEPADFMARWGEQKREDGDGMSPEHVGRVMESLMRHQDAVERGEVRKKAG